MTRRLTLTEDQHHLLLSLVRSEQAVYSRHHVSGGLSAVEDRREEFLARLGDDLEGAERVSSTTPARGPIDELLDDLGSYLAAHAGAVVTASILADYLCRLYTLLVEKHGMLDERETRMAVLSRLFHTNLGETAR